MTWMIQHNPKLIPSSRIHYSQNPTNSISSQYHTWEKYQYLLLEVQKYRDFRGVTTGQQEIRELQPASARLGIVIYFLWLTGIKMRQFQLIPCPCIATTGCKVVQIKCSEVLEMHFKLDTISLEYQMNISGLPVKMLVIDFIGIGSNVRDRSGAYYSSPKAPRSQVKNS